MLGMDRLTLYRAVDITTGLWGIWMPGFNAVLDGRLSLGRVVLVQLLPRPGAIHARVMVYGPGAV